LDRPGSFGIGTSGFISGHAGAVLDIEWSPFDDSMMATASEDTNIKIWSIPEDWEPIDEHGHAKPGKEFKDSLVDLTGHTKKVTLLRYHPTASNTLLSTGADYTVKVWDVENSIAVSSFDDISNLVHDIIWDVKGDMYAFTCKDKNARFIDPRTGKCEQKIEKIHGGAKSIKLVFANDSGKLFSCGASKQSAREIKVWDMNNLSKPIHTEPVDTAAGAMIPLWDSDTNVLYLCGKGDGVVRLYEYEDKEPYIFKLNDGFRSNIPGKGYCLVPKRGLDVMKHETARILKVTNNEGIHPLGFIVPRKSDAFQDDIFPPTASTVPAHSHQEWFEGSSKTPEMVSLKPGATPAAASGAGGAKKATFKTVGSLSKELDDAKKRIAYLEKKLAEASIEF
jgi:coronin-1B/1C/6